MEEIQRRNKISRYWYNNSSDLRASAAALRICNDPDIAARTVAEYELGGGFLMPVATSKVFRMLCGMSMELIFKALSVERGEEVNQSSHDLLQHLSTTGLSYSPTERELLKILSHATTWSGRYPSPKKQDALEVYQDLVNKNMYDSRPLGSGTLKILTPNNALDWDSFNGMWKKAMRSYFEIQQA